MGPSSYIGYFCYFVKISHILHIRLKKACCKLKIVTRFFSIKHLYSSCNTGMSLSVPTATQASSFHKLSSQETWTCIRLYRYANTTSTFHTMQILHQHFTQCKYYTNISHNANTTPTFHTMQILHQHFTQCKYYTNILHNANTTPTFYTMQILHQHFTQCKYYTNISHNANTTPTLI